jgi:WD40 repeat protein
VFHLNMELRVARFVDYKPAAILSIASSGDLCAVLKADSSLWVYRAWTLLHVIPGKQELDHRIVLLPNETEIAVTGLSGKVFFYSLNSLDHTYRSNISGGGVLAFQSHGQFFAHACKNGTVSVYKRGKGYKLIQLFQKQDGVMTSVTWTSETTLASGSDIGSIFLWKLGESVAYQHIASSGASINALVCLGGYLISGDNGCHVRVWETQFGTLI